MTSQPPRVGVWLIVELISWDCEWQTKLNCPTLLEEELTSQRHSCRTTELPPGKSNNRSDHLAQTGSVVSQVPVATCPCGQK
jgi:hypothetical protein